MYPRLPSPSAAWLSALVPLLILAASSAAAQQTGSIRGKVVEASSLQPLAGAQVSIEGTGRGGLTNDAGDFLLLNVPAGEYSVRVDMIGYRTATERVTVTAGQLARVDFRLQLQAVALDEIVVTGVPTATSKVTLGNAIASIRVGDIVDRVSNQTVTELLQARAPALTYLASSGSPGTSGTMRIRGASSLSITNYPAVYVDGVRIDVGHAGNFLNSCCGEGTASVARIVGSQHTLGLDFINPEDIESIEVVKGPAAATLYGAEAATGVIQIITKKGRPGQQPMRWNLQARQGQVDWAVDPITNYNTCTAARKAATRTVTIDGVRQTVPAFPGCQDVPEGTVLKYAGLKDTPGVLRVGGLRNYSLSVRGGGEGFSFFVSGDWDDEEGVFQNNFMERGSGRANFTFYPRANLDFSLNVGYTNTKIRYPLGDEDARALVRSAVEYEPGEWLPPTATIGFAWIQPQEGYRFDNRLFSERIILGSTVNYRPFPWFRNRFTLGLDYNDRVARKVNEPNSAFSTIGQVLERRPRDRVITVDYGGTISRSLTENLFSAFSFGGQWIKSTYRSTYAMGQGYASGLLRMVNQGAERFGSDAFSERAILGLYVQEQLGWKDRLYVTGGLRMDNNSVFGDEIRRVFYPKLQVSWLVSEEPFFKLPRVDELRLRGAWGAAGNAPGPFAAVRSYSATSLTRADGSSAPAIIQSAYGNPKLQAERGEEIELGLDASLFGNRLGIEFTYYDKRIEDALMTVPVPPSSGFTGSQWQNLGETLNRGIELTLTAIPMQTRPVTWESKISLYTNKNELVSFGYERGPIILSLYGWFQRHQPGFPLGGYWATFPKYNPDGTFVRSATGRIVYEDTARYVGPALPTREIGWSNTFRIFGNVQVYALLDYKGGHYLYNFTDQSRCFHTRLSCPQVNPPDKVDDELYGALTGKWKDGSIATGFWERHWWFIQKADFVKLRDVSVTYTLPDHWAQRFRATRLSVTLMGRNLAEWSPDFDGPDPEVSTGGVDDFWRAWAYTAPQLRRLSASVNVTF